VWLLKTGIIRAIIACLNKGRNILSEIAKSRIMEIMIHEDRERKPDRFWLINI